MDTAARERRPLVLVGVDGSAASELALAWAERYVERTGGLLEVVTCWHLPVQYGFPLVAVDYDAQGAAQAVVESAAATVALPPDQVRTTVLPGHAATALVQHSRSCDLLVLGTRGLGGFSGLLLGSVSSYCTHHASCSVVVVRAGGAEPTA